MQNNRTKEMQSIKRFLDGLGIEYQNNNQNTISFELFGINHEYACVIENTPLFISFVAKDENNNKSYFDCHTLQDFVFATNYLE